MKRIISFLVLFTLLFSLTACDGYVSSFKAVGLVRSNTSHSCKTSFLSLEGQIVFKLKRSEAGEGDISYSVEAKEGEIHLYYAIGDVKEELAVAKGGEKITSRGGYVEGKKPVYIIIEATEESRGAVSVDLDK